MTLFQNNIMLYIIMGKYQNFQYEQPRTCGSLPPMHFLDNDDENVIDATPDEYNEFSMRALAYKGPDTNLFEDEVPRHASGRSGVMNSWYNNHRGYGNDTPVHPELNTDFIGKEWNTDNPHLGGPDKSKVVNQGAYRHRYKYLYPDADPSTPQSGVYEHELRDWTYKAANSTYRNVKYFERELENYIRGNPDMGEGLKNNGRNLIMHADMNYGKNHGNPRVGIRGSTSINPAAIREYKAQGATDAQFARNYKDAMFSNPDAGMYKHGTKEKFMITDKEQFSTSRDVNRYTKQALKKDLKSLNRMLIQHDGKFNDSKSKMAIRSAIQKGEQLLGRLRKLKGLGGDTAMATERDKMILSNYNGAIAEIGKTAQLRKIAGAEGLLNRDYGIYGGRISTRDANHRAAQQKTIAEKFGQLHKLSMLTKSAKQNKNQVRAMQKNSDFSAFNPGQEKSGRFTHRNMNGLRGDPHKRNMDRFTSGLSFGDSSSYMGGRKGAGNPALPELGRQYTQGMQEFDGDNRGMITNRKSAFQDDKAKYSTDVDLFAAM